MLLIIQII